MSGPRKNAALPPELLTRIRDCAARGLTRMQAAIELRCEYAKIANASTNHKIAFARARKPRTRQNAAATTFRPSSPSAPSSLQARYTGIKKGLSRW